MAHGERCSGRAAAVHKAASLFSECCAWLCPNRRPTSKLSLPFSISAPGFFTFLVEEKGLRPNTLHNYTYTLRPFESYLERAGVELSELTPACITAFLTERVSYAPTGGVK